MKGIIGAIIGNSVGRTYSIKTTRDYNFNMICDKGNPGDDSIAIIAVADWLMHTNHTKDELIDKLHYWCDKYNYGMWHHDLNTTFKEWIRKKKREPYNSYGNESAMRVIPVAWYAKSEDECLELAKISAEVTHNHPEGIKGAQAVALGVYLLKNGVNKTTVWDKIQKKFKYNFGKTYKNLYNTHKYQCICQVSVPASYITWWYSNDYIDCIRKAVSLGGDCDTEAAIAGALSAATNDIDENFVDSIIRFFPMDFLAVFREFHENYEL